MKKIIINPQTGEGFKRKDITKELEDIKEGKKTFFIDKFTEEWENIFTDDDLDLIEKWYLENDTEKKEKLYDEIINITYELLDD